MVEVQLGATYRDIVTGFQGTAYAITRYLSGCDRIGLTRMGGDDVEKVMTCDVTMVEFVSPPTTAILQAVERANGAGAVRGGPHRNTPSERTVL